MPCASRILICKHRSICTCSDTGVSMPRAAPSPVPWILCLTEPGDCLLDLRDRRPSSTERNRLFHHPHDQVDGREPQRQRQLVVVPRSFYPAVEILLLASKVRNGICSGRLAHNARDCRIGGAFACRPKTKPGFNSSVRHCSSVAEGFVQRLVCSRPRIRDATGEPGHIRTSIGSVRFQEHSALREAECHG